MERVANNKDYFTAKYVWKETLQLFRKTPIDMPQI